MISINQKVDSPDKVRYVKEDSGKVRKMYVRKTDNEAGKIYLQKLAEPRPDKPIYVYAEHTTYFSEEEAKTGFVSRMISKI